MIPGYHLTWVGWVIVILLLLQGYVFISRTTYRFCFSGRHLNQDDGTSSLFGALWPLFWFGFALFGVGVSGYMLADWLWDKGYRNTFERWGLRKMRI